MGVKMKKLKVFIGIILILILGMLVGMLGTGFFIKHRIGRFIGGEGPLPPIRLLERLSGKLDLSKPQQIEIDKILKQAHTQLIEFRRGYRPEFEKIFNDTIEQIKQKLDNRQKQKLEKLTESIKQRFRKHPGRHPLLFEKTPELVFSEMKKRLNLTREQEAVVRPIIERGIENQHEILKKYEDQQDQLFHSLKNEMDELQKSVERRLGNTLTAEQMENYRGFNEGECFMMRRYRTGAFH